MTYYQNLTFEKIEVIVHFLDLEAVILKFKWNNTVYKVDKIANKWKIPQGEKLTTHFTVICEKEGIIAELCFHHSDFKWELIQWDNL
jgi:hypothetical protein